MDVSSGLSVCVVLQVQAPGVETTSAYVLVPRPMTKDIEDDALLFGPATVAFLCCLVCFSSAQTSVVQDLNVGFSCLVSRFSLIPHSPTRRLAWIPRR